MINIYCYTENFEKIVMINRLAQFGAVETTSYSVKINIDF